MKNRTFKKVWSIALAGVMALTLGLFSADLPAQAGTGGTPGSPADAVVTKTLQIADGITTPTETFTFDFTAHSYNGDTSTTVVGGMPGITQASIAFGSGDSPTGGVITKESADVLTGITWTAAGLYTYTVTETAGTITGMTYSQAEYTLEVLVANDGSGNLYVEETAVKQKTDDDGNTSTDPKGDPGSNGGNGSDMEFVNVFTKGGGDDSGTDALTIGKTVAGTYGDQTKDFEFTLDVVFPSTATSGDSYAATVCDASGTPITPITTYNLVVGGTTSITFDLKHDQTLVFVSLPAGTTYTLSEAANTNYAPSYSVVQNSGSPATTGSAASGAALSTGAGMLVGENINTADFINTFDDSSVTPTGILMNNLPYMLLIAAALLALIAFVAVKRRREML